MEHEHVVDETMKRMANYASLQWILDEQSVFVVLNDILLGRIKPNNTRKIFLKYI